MSSNSAVFLRVNRFVISHKLDTTNKRMLQYELLTVKNMNYTGISSYAFFIRYIF